MFGLRLGRSKEPPTYLGAIGKMKLDESTTQDLQKVGSLIMGNILGGLPQPPKTYERLVHDLYLAGWKVDEAKTLLNGGSLPGKPPEATAVAGA